MLSSLPEIRDGVAVVTIDHPPVNALDPGTLAAIVAALDEADGDGAIRAVVLRGARGTFSGGADMRHFGGPPAGPTLRDVIARLETMTKPVVAAIEGIALGGGLELALGCDGRVATPGARVGLPEIKRGLLPGAGGTQRLPRLIGVAPALALILSGEPVHAARAAELGIVDTVSDDVAGAAVTLALAIAPGRRRISERTAHGGDAEIAAARAEAQPEERGGLAAHRAIDAVEAAVRRPFADGLVRERSGFDELLRSEQSKARIALFFAEREAARAPQDAPPPVPVRRVAVIGAGTMGAGIATACADRGLAVALIDTQDGAVARARETMTKNWSSAVAKGRFAPDEAEARLARVTFAGALDAVAGADLVIEAVFEDMDVKQRVFRDLDRLTGPGTTLATNTSTLDVDAIAAVTSRPEEVVGLHFFSPANVMKLLEIVRGATTSPATLARALAIAKTLGKIAVVSGNADGFIGNRMLHPYRREAEFCVEEGATPQQVDRVIRDFGFAMGPFAMGDLAGLDIGWRIRKRRHAERPPAGRYSPVNDRLCEAGRFGQKTGAGWYRYEAGSRTPLPDPYVEELVARTAREAGIARRAVGDDEIRERCLFALVNEAATLLEEGVAARAGDVDVCWVYGYGFPAWRGGPLRWADSVGLAHVVTRMRAYEREHGAFFTPAPLLLRLAERGETFRGA